MAQYFLRFFRSENRAVTTTMAVHATDLQEAVAVGLRQLLPAGGTVRSEQPGQLSDLASIAQAYSVTAWKVPDDMKDAEYPHV